jgi:hypothetical protein
MNSPIRRDCSRSVWARGKLLLEEIHDNAGTYSVRQRPGVDHPNRSFPQACDAGGNPIVEKRKPSFNEPLFPWNTP